MNPKCPSQIRGYTPRFTVAAVSHADKSALAGPALQSERIFAPLTKVDVTLGDHIHGRMVGMTLRLVIVLDSSRDDIAGRHKSHTGRDWGFSASNASEK